MTAAVTNKEASIAKLNADLNGHKNQVPNLPPGETVDTLIAKEDGKLDLSKLKLFKDVPSDAPDPPKVAVDPDAPADGAADTTIAPAPPTRTLKERAKDLEKLASQRADKFRKDRAARDDAAAARAETAAAKAEAAKLADQNTRTIALLEQAQKDPIAWLAKQGVTAVQLAKAAVTQGTSKEQIAKTALEEKIDAVLAENKALKDEQKIKDDAAAAEKARTDSAAKLEADKTAFVDFFKEGGEVKYPTLTRVVGTPEKIVAKFIGFVHSLQADPDTAAELKKNPEQYTDAVLLALFERVTAKEIAEFNKDAAGNKAQTVNGTTPGNKAGTKTATRRSNGKQFVPPANWEKLSDPQQNKLIAEWTEKHAVKTE